MTSQIPFTPLTPEALSRLTPDERSTFTLAVQQVAAEQKPSMMTIVALVEMVVRLIGEQQPEAREVKRLEASVVAGDALIREILEALCHRDGLPLESTIVPGEPARNYDLAMRLGIGHVFGISGGPESHGAGTGSLDTAQALPSAPEPSREALGASSPERPAAAEVSLEMCRAFGREIGLVQVERDEARAKLAAIGAHCRKHAEWVSLHCPDLGRPAEALVKADDILAITGTGEAQ